MDDMDRSEGFFGRLRSTKACCELLLVTLMACWMACSMLFAFQLYGQGCTDGHFRVYYIFCGVHFMAFARAFIITGRGLSYESFNKADATEPDPSNRKVMFSLSDSAFRVVLFLLVVFPFFAIKKQGMCTQIYIPLSLAFLMFEGYAILHFLKHFKSACDGLFICLQAGVVCTSYSGLSDKDSQLCRVFVCLLSLTSVFLSSVYLSLCANETSPIPSKAQQANPNANL